MSNLQPSEDLESQRKSIIAQIEKLSGFRRGTISVNYRKCGKKNCVCAQPGHPGHGPQYLWSTTIKGKSQARNLICGPELAAYQKHTDDYRRFQQLVAQLVEVNEQICARQPIPAIEDPDELEALKKKLRSRWLPKSKKKSAGS